MLLGQRVAAAIIDTEMSLAGCIRLDMNTSKRLAAYLEEPQLRERFLADAELIAGEAPETLTEAFLILIPNDYEISMCLKGIKVVRCNRK